MFMKYIVIIIIKREGQYKLLGYRRVITLKGYNTSIY
jgi:hypothetical protein